jgi:uncharacterized linocin/CFP29 family protein
MNLGRESVGWAPERWDQLDLAIHGEATRAGVGARLLPLVGPFPDAVVVPADEIEAKRLAIDEAKTTALVEVGAGFTLTGSQATAASSPLTATTLVQRATSLVVQAEDALIFQGSDAVPGLPAPVEVRQPVGPGLLKAAASDVEVPQLEGAGGHYGGNTFEAVARAISLLGSLGHPGPYALALSSDQFADTYAPLPGTLATPADRIAPLVAAGFAGTGALPTKTGVLFSVGGNPVDLLIGIDPTLAFTQIASDGALQFRVFERFVLRVKDPRALVRIRFLDK